jgi:hypothetical protein
MVYGPSEDYEKPEFLEDLLSIKQSAPSHGSYLVISI